MCLKDIGLKGVDWINIDQDGEIGSLLWMRQWTFGVP
jgi:hypothetical protein